MSWPNGQTMFPNKVPSLHYREKHPACPKVCPLQLQPRNFTTIRRRTRSQNSVPFPRQLVCASSTVDALKYGHFFTARLRRGRARNRWERIPPLPVRLINATRFRQMKSLQPGTLRFQVARIFDEISLSVFLWPTVGPCLPFCEASSAGFGQGGGIPVT